MKKKFIMVIAALILIVALFAIAVPVMSPDVGPTAGAVALTADLAPMDTGAALVIDKTAPVSAATAGEITIWLALSASLLTIAVVFRRSLAVKLFDLRAYILRRRNDSTLEGTGSSGVPRDCILPGVA